MLLEKLWDDVVAGPQPERGLGKLRKIPTLTIKGNYTLSLSLKRAHTQMIMDHDDLDHLKSLCDGEGSSNSKYQRSMSMPASPGTPSTPMTPTTPSPTGARKENVWRSVFHPGSNLATRGIGAEVFDKPQPNTPTVYDWYIFFHP
ncbi:Dormancy/auxin associated protein [Dillenia turbinata]|uniref:Dormancy/auxin associated protein n=1 Tax=Dillenia turbinata TaxID=194707 RepID=A0AAN8ZCB2_9MAGN